MARYIDADKLIEHIKDLPTWFKEDGWWHSTKYPNGHFDCDDVINSIDNAPTADVEEVVRCKDCKHSINLDKNCVLNRNVYKHCQLWRGEELTNIWHRYKKYYKDYSIVELDGFCDSGERRDT